MFGLYRILDYSGFGYKPEFWIIQNSGIQTLNNSESCINQTLNKPEYSGLSQNSGLFRVWYIPEFWFIQGLVYTEF